MNFAGYNLLQESAPFYRRLLTGHYAKEWWSRDAPYQYTPEFYAEATRYFVGEGKD